MNAAASRPTIGVVVPTYLRDDLLKIALDSVVAQTDDSGITVYVGDNAKSPETQALVATYGPNFRYLAWPENLGAPGNYAQLVLETVEDYVICLHDDNVLLPTFVEQMRDVVVAQPDIDAVFSAFDLIDGEGRKLPTDDLNKSSFRSSLPAGRWKFGRRTRSFLVLVRQSFQPGVPCLIRRSVLQPKVNRAAESVTYDYNLMASVGLSATLFYIPEVLTLSRVHGRSYTSSVGWIPDRLTETRRLGGEVPTPFDRGTLKILAARDEVLLRYEKNPVFKVAYKALDGALFRWSDAPLKALVNRSG
jgi:glycosyltransferase involved in cell wall biosynthesis